MTLKNLSNILRKKLKSIKFDFFKNHFDLLVPSVLVKKFYETKNKKKSNELSISFLQIQQLLLF